MTTYNKHLNETKRNEMKHFGLDIKSLRVTNDAKETKNCLLFCFFFKFIANKWKPTEKKAT